MGVNHSPVGRSLAAAENDAKDLTTCFRQLGYWDPAHNVCCTGKAASASRVKDQLQKCAAAGSLDLLVIYWAGHMDVLSGQHRLITHDPGRSRADSSIELNAVMTAFLAPSPVQSRY